MKGFRSPEGQNAYEHFLESLEANRCVLCEKEEGRRFKYWKIVVNDFPYDRIASRHDMIVPIRHITEEGLSDEEKDELRKLKNILVNGNGIYDYIIEPKAKSIPGHFHLHLIVSKDS